MGQPDPPAPFVTPTDLATELWLGNLIRTHVGLALQDALKAQQDRGPDEILSAEQVAELLTTNPENKVRAKTVIKHTKEGRIPGLNLGQGHGWRYSKHEVLKAIGTYQTPNNETE